MSSLHSIIYISELDALLKFLMRIALEHTLWFIKHVLAARPQS